ncbi:hypothetical protein K7432_013055, partial [Basidiobolus ranarum]
MFTNFGTDPEGTLIYSGETQGAFQVIDALHNLLNHLGYSGRICGTTVCDTSLTDPSVIEARIGQLEELIFETHSFMNHANNLSTATYDVKEIQICTTFLIQLS